MDQQTDQPRDHATRSVTIGRTYVRSTAMRPNNIAIILSCYCSVFKNVQKHFECSPQKTVIHYNTTTIQMKRHKELQTLTKNGLIAAPIHA